MAYYTEAGDIAWTARMAWSDRIGGPGLEVRRMRRSFTLHDIPQTAVVHVTAESRYVLYVNGKRVGRGPLKGTPAAYHYETYEIAHRLRRGTNLIAAEVRWYGADRPVSEVHTYRAGLMVQAEGLPVDTPEGWVVLEDRAVAADRTSWFANSQTFLTHMELVDASSYVRGWTELDYDDSAWEPASDAGPAGNLSLWGVVDTPFLQPRPVAALIEDRRRFTEARVNRTPVPVGEWRVPAGSGGELIVSAGELTTGFPELRFIGGAGRKVEIVYAECALFRPQPGDEGTIPAPDGPWVKRLRDDIENGEVAGYRDTITLDGEPFTWEPFHWRTFWFIAIRVPEGPTELVLDEPTYRFTTYPAKLTARFDCGREGYARIWEMSWRTLRLCSHETFEDCPYYEQLHYLGDARLEALTHLYLSGETDYVKHSISLYRNSARWDGLVESRTPSFESQIIPYFALLWVLMVNDFYRYAGAAEERFVRSCLHAVDGVLGYFRDRLRDDGFVGKVHPWNMVDRADEWPRGEPAALVAGESTYLTCLFILALRTAAALHRDVGFADDAPRWEHLANRITPLVRDATWDETAGLFLEGPGRTNDRLSQHSQVMAVLSGVATAPQTARVLERLTDDESLISMKLMQSFYLAQVLERTDNFTAFHTKLLRPWFAMQDLHLSTCAEYFPGRSDCHAWSSWPALAFVRTILGIRPDAPGFASVAITPRTNELDHAAGEVTAPVGTIRVAWRRDGEQVKLKAVVPAGVPTRVVLGSSERRFPSGGEIELTA